LTYRAIEALNRAFTTWVEEEYHQREHGSLGMRPIDRFGIDLPRIRFLPTGDVNDELFFVEQDRTVLVERAIVYFKGERMGARLADFIGNDRKPSKKSVTAPPPAGVEP